MCHGDDSRAPGAPGHGEAAEHGDLVLTSAEGTSFAAAYAVPSRPTGNAVVVMPDVRGLHAYYRDLVVRLAEVGMHAVAIDYFGRTAGVGERADGFDYKPHVHAGT